MKIAKMFLFLVEVVASIYVVDMAFSFISQPSDLLLLTGVATLFVVFMFWVYRYSHYQKGKLLEKFKGIEQGIFSPWLAEAKKVKGDQNDDLEQAKTAGQHSVGHPSGGMRQ